MIENTIDKVYLENWIKNIKTAHESNNLEFEIDILFYDGVKQIKNLRYSKFQVDQDLIESMYTRLCKAYSKKKISSYNIDKFNLIANNEQTFYLCKKSTYSNLKIGLNYITKKKSKNNFSKDDLKNAVSLAFKVTYTDVNNKSMTDIAFCGIQNFNRLKYSNLSMMGEVQSINDINTISKVDDKHLYFGINEKVDAVFISVADTFIVNPKGKMSFEKIFLLAAQYKQIANSVAKSLSNYPNELPNISNLYADFYSKQSGSTPIMDRMLAKLTNSKKNSDLKNLLSNSKNWKKRLNEISKFKNNPQFKNKFKNLKISPKNGTLTYNKDSVYEFLAVLSDRPKETILLKEQELGS